MLANNEHSNSNFGSEPLALNQSGYTPSSDEIWKLLQGVNDRLSKLEHRYGYIASAFPTNDLGKPDFDGHRKEHLQFKKESAVVEGYKEGATKTVLNYAAIGAIVIFLAGTVDWIRTHLK